MDGEGSSDWLLSREACSKVLIAHLPLTIFMPEVTCRPIFPINIVKYLGILFPINLLPIPGNRFEVTPMIIVWQLLLFITGFFTNDTLHCRGILVEFLFLQ